MASELEAPLLLRCARDGAVRLDDERLVSYTVVYYHRADSLVETSFVYEHVGPDWPTGEQLRQAAVDHERARRGRQ